MPVIHLHTVINAPRERVFDLARSIDAHLDTTSHTGERVVAGVASGLLNGGEEVTWEARHLGVKQRLQSKMTEFDRPNRFQDTMLTGAFHSLKHDHIFEVRDGRTVMTDRFEFRSPLGPLGWLVDRLFLTTYMRRFLEQRNAMLKQTAESDAWRKYLLPAGTAPQQLKGGTH
jgi:ligand-binding SRPBCC domain-containing protein